MTAHEELEAANKALEEARKRSDALGINHHTKWPSAWRSPPPEALEANRRLTEARHALYRAQARFEASKEGREEDVVAVDVSHAPAPAVAAPNISSIPVGSIKSDQPGPRPWDRVEANPPPAAEMIVRLFAPARDREAILGDLLEGFEDNLNRYGVRWARRAYWFHAICSIPKFLLELLVFLLIRLAA